MRCYYLLDQPDKAFSFANEVYTNEDTPESIRRTAAIWLGRINYDSGELDRANELFTSTVTFGGNIGAESQYMISKIHFDKGEYSEAEQGVFTLVGDYATYEDWKHKGFILLVKSYIGLEDLFQARATAESIIENVEIPWLQDECSDLMMEIETLEAIELENEDNE